jgi:hypothetical protein
MLLSLKTSPVPLDEARGTLSEVEGCYDPGG